MNRSFLIVALCAILLMSVMQSDSFSSEAELIAARVGQVNIPENMLQDAMTNYVPPGTFHATITREQKDKYRGDALNELIDFELLYQEAIKREIKIPKDTIEGILDQNIKRFGSKKKLSDALKKSNLTLKQFEKRIESIQMVKQLLQNISAESEPSADELTAYYQENKNRYLRPESMHIYHIIVKVDPAANEDERNKKKEYAESILKEIREGKDFGLVAYEKSEDAFKFKSGDIGVVHRGQFEFRDIEDAAFALKEGDVSDVLKSIHGFHILKSGEKKPAQQLTFDEMKDTIRKDKIQKKFMEKRSALIEQLKKDIKVVIFDPPAPAGAKK